jgi:chromosome segregation protein
MIVISHIEMAGFRGFRNRVRFDVPKGFVVLTGRNGAGKSTVFDAIDYAFTGSINKYGVRGAKGGGLEEHLWWIGGGAETDYYVAIGLKNNEGDTWEIRRRRDGSLAGDDLSKISSLLHQDAARTADWPIALIQTALIRDELIAAMSLDLTEQARFAAVKAALGTSDTTAHLAHFRKIVTAAEMAKAEQQSRHTKSHEALGRLLTSLTEMRSLADRQTQFTRAKDTFVAELGSTWRSDAEGIAVARNAVAERRRALNSMRDAITDAKRVLVRYRETTAGEFLNRLEVLSQEAHTLEAQISQIDVLKAAANQALAQAQQEDARTTTYLALLDEGERLGLQGEACPLCGSTLTADQFRAAIRTAKAVLGRSSPATGPALAALEQASRDERDIAQRLRTIREDSSRMEESLERSRSAYESLNFRFQLLRLGHLDELTVAEATVLEQEEHAASLEQALSVLETSTVNDRITEVSARVEQQRKVVEEDALQLSRSELAVERAKQMENVAKIVRNELLSEQLDTVLPLLKELYLRLRPHADWREIEIDVAGQVRASLNLLVGDGKNPQFLFSSGQRRAAGLAFLLALFLARPWCGLDTLLMDDPVQHIDDYRALNLAEVLSSIRKSGRQVIIAVEDAALADLLCRRLRSQTDEPGRRFELDIDADGSAHVAGQFDIPSLSSEVLQMAPAS